MTELRVGIVGAGLIAGVHARAYAATPGVDVVVIADPVLEKATRLAAKSDAVPVAGLDELLEHDLDIVSVCTPTPTHALMTIPALEAGLHVLCEKPLARTLEDAERILDADARSPGLLSVGHVSRYEPDHAQAQRLVADGHLGRVTMMSHSVATSMPSWSEHGWLGDHALSGGPLVDLAVHSFDYVSWITGSRVCRVSAVAADSPAGPDTYTLATLRTESGAIAQVETSWAHPPSYGFKLSTEITGVAGRLAWSYDTIAGGFLHRRSAETIRFDPIGETGYLAEIRAFVAAVRAGGPPPVSGPDAFAALSTSLAAVESLRTGSSVEPRRASR